MRRSVGASMKILGNLYQVLQLHCDFTVVSDNARDLFRRKNFALLRTAVDLYNSKEDDTIKPGLKQNIFYLLKRSAKLLQGLLLEEEKYEVADTTILSIY